MQKKFYGRFFRFARFVFCLFSGKKYQLDDPFPEDPVVYIGHHQNLRGPLRTMQWLDHSLHLWVLHVFFDQKACFDQYYGYTLTKRLHWPKPLAWIVAKLASYVVSSLMRSMRAIPVYRGTAHMRTTLSMSLDALYAGESLAIFPDIDYSSNSDQMGEIYSGFLGLERFYFKKTGRHLKFVPLGVDVERHRFSIGEPVVFRDELPFQDQKDELAAILRDRINALQASENDSAALPL